MYNSQKEKKFNQMIVKSRQFKIILVANQQMQTLNSSSDQRKSIKPQWDSQDNGKILNLTIPWGAEMWTTETVLLVRMDGDAISGNSFLELDTN